MIELLNNPAFRTLFVAQIIALTGTGLTTIALALLAYEFAAGEAGIVLGTALAIKMIAYVFISPVITGLTVNSRKKQYLIFLSIGRALFVISLFYVSAIWQIYIIIFCLQALSAGFTPIYQSVISDILTEDSLFIKGSSLSRIAYNLENILSPTIAILILAFIDYTSFFIVNAICFGVSALLILVTYFPQAGIQEKVTISFWKRSISGVALFFNNRKLAAILCLNMVIAASGAMIIVNSVAIIQGFFNLSESELAIAMLFYGIGAIISAIFIFLISGKVNYKAIMLLGAFLTFIISFASAFIQSYSQLVLSWACFGFASTFILVPIGQLLRAETIENNRTAIFGAQFSLSHACWLITYPLLGYLLVLVGLKVSFLIIAGIVLSSTLIAWFLWYSPKGKLFS